MKDQHARSRRKRHRLTPQQSESRAAYMFLMPWFIGLVLITIGPVIASLYLSFTRYNLFSAPQWVGFENYIDLLFWDQVFHDSVIATAIYVLCSVPLILIASLLVAAVLNQGLSGLAIYRSLFYIPSLIGSSVAIGFLWLQVFGDEGIFNDFLGWFGIAGKSWVSDPSTAPATLVALNVWTFGASMVIFLAGLRQIPASYYEAAKMDGASSIAIFRRITLPLLSPIIFFNLILLTIQSFQGFTQAWILSRGTGGPANSLMLYTVYLYKQAFEQLNMGAATAMAWLLLLVIALITGVLFWSARYWVFYGDDKQ
ncbi:sugar ABC transporter permease [Nitratireductor sp. B36]|uniref:carbohydrate ABC transporter permease n=1 Tax=Nitratireductor sp. B36 TaxID=2762059 RepID=UPI001E55E583|nr:sugar ABC transporter permease [Nitratireductor sp. B36]MCC5781006.1 sugar ABC transporter permease [Nitratireductor sp. B36]